MAVKYGNHDFPSDFGFSGSCGKSRVRTHMRNAPTVNDAKGGPVNDCAGGRVNRAQGGAVRDSGSESDNGRHHRVKDSGDYPDRSDPPRAAGVKAGTEPRKNVPGKPRIERAAGGTTGAQPGDMAIGDDAGGALSQVAMAKPPAIRGMAPRGRTATHKGIAKGIPTFSAKPKIS